MTKWICKACKAINPIISGVCHNCGADYYELETVELRTNTKELSERIDREVERWMKIRAENKWLKEENLNSLKKLELMLADYTDCVDENKRLRAANEELTKRANSVVTLEHVNRTTYSPTALAHYNQAIANLDEYLRSTKDSNGSAK